MSLPNCMVALLHWRILLTLISRLSPHAQAGIHQIKNQCTFLREPKVNNSPRAKPVAADGHCHIDLLLKKMNSLKYDDAVEEFIFLDKEVNIDVIIPCYVFPQMFSFEEQLELLPPSAWNFTAGFHLRSVEW